MTSERLPQPPSAGHQDSPARVVFGGASSHAEFWPDSLRLRPEPVLRFHRYRRPGDAPRAIIAVAEEMVGLAEKLVEPRVIHVKRAVEALGPDRLTLAGGPTFHARAFATHLSGATGLLCFVATIGGALEARVTELSDARELLEALFLDSAGWLAAEATLRAFRRHVTSAVRPARLSPRLAPGYLDWPLTEQAALFSLFDPASLPVTLNEYCVMSPQKSVSGVFGLKGA